MVRSTGSSGQTASSVGAAGEEDAGGKDCKRREEEATSGDGRNRHVLEENLEQEAEESQTLIGLQSISATKHPLTYAFKYGHQDLLHRLTRESLTTVFVKGEEEPGRSAAEG